MSTMVFSPAPSAMTTPTRSDPLPLPLPPPDHVDSRPESFYPDSRTPPAPPKRIMTTPPPRRHSGSPQVPPRRDSVGDAVVHRHLTPPPSTRQLLSPQLPSPASASPTTAGQPSESPSPVPSHHRPMSAATESFDSPFLAPLSAPSMPLPTLAPLVIHPPSLSTESALSSPASSTRGLLLTPPLSPSRVSTLSPTHTSISSTIVFPLINVPMSVPPSLRPAVSPMRYQQILGSFQSCYMSYQRQIYFHKCALAFSLFNLFISYVLMSIRSLRKSDLPIILAYMIVAALFSLVATINWYASYASQLESMEDIASKLNREAMQAAESDDEDEGIDVGGAQVHTVSRRGHGQERARRSIWLPPSDTTLDAMWSVARDPVAKCNVVVKVTVHGPISLLVAYSSVGASRAGDLAAPFSPTGLSGTTFTGCGGSPRPPTSPRNVENAGKGKSGSDPLVGKLESRPPLVGEKALASQPPTTSIMRSSLLSYSSDRQLLGPHPPLPTHSRPPSVQSPNFPLPSSRQASVSSTADHHKAQPRYPPANNPVLGGRRPSLVSLLNEGPLVPTQYPKPHTMPLPPSSKTASPTSVSPLEAAASPGAAAPLLGSGSYGTVPGRRPSDASVTSSNLPPQFRHLFASLDRPLDRRPSFALLPPAKSSRPPLLGDLDLGPSQLLEAIEEASSSLEQAISTSKQARPDTVATSVVEADSLVALYATTSGSVPPTPTRSSVGLSVIAAQLRMRPWTDASEEEEEDENPAAARLHSDDQRQRELERLQEELRQLEMEVSKG